MGDDVEVCYAAGYAFFLSPNQTPYRDMYFLMKLTGLGENDGVQVNAVFTAICLMMGVWPCIYSALLIPSARSGNKASHDAQDGSIFLDVLLDSIVVYCRASMTADCTVSILAVDLLRVM